MAPIIVTRSTSQDSTESSINHKDLLKTNGGARYEEEEKKDDELNHLPDSNLGELQLQHRSSLEDSSLDSKLHRQTSDLFVDEDELRKGRYNSTNTRLPSIINTKDHDRHQAISSEGLFLPSSNTQRFGLISPSGLGELEDVSLSTSPLSNNQSTETFGRTPFGNNINQTQIDADEELARSLQAEEDKKRQRGKPRPLMKSTLECWVEDSMNEIGRQLCAAATDFFGGRS